EPLTISRSAGTFPKYASLTTGPSAASGPGANGSAMVVSGEGVNIPRIQIETSPDSGCHGALPALVTVLDDSNATVRTALPGDSPSCVVTSAAVSRRTVRSTSISTC